MTQATAHTARRYQLSAQDTAVRFTTRHLAGLAPVRGAVRLVSGHAVVDAADGSLREVEAELDMTSFDSASRARDRVVASPAFLDSVAHPRAGYRSTSVERRPGGWLVHGVLTAKGLAAPVDLLVEELEVSAQVRVRATAVVDRRRHGVTVPSALAARHLHVELDVRAHRADGA